MDEAMKKALEADGEKLRQLTGEDHGPWPVYDPESAAAGGPPITTGRVRMCDECGQHPADYPSKICVGCEAYRDHTQ